MKGTGEALPVLPVQYDPKGALKRLSAMAQRARKAYEAMNEATTRLDEAEAAALTRALEEVAVALPALAHPIDVTAQVGEDHGRFRGVEISTVGRAGKARVLYLVQVESRDLLVAGKAWDLVEVGDGRVCWLDSAIALEHGHELAHILQNLAAAVSKQVVSREVHAKGRLEKAQQLEAMLKMMAKVAR